jgi:hypothetical protein
MTKLTDPIDSASPFADHNRTSVDRAHLMLNSWLKDALEKAEFSGQVAIGIQICGGKIVLVRPTIEQTIKA